MGVTRRRYFIGVRGRLVISLLFLVVISIWLLGLAFMQLTKSAFIAQFNSRAKVLTSAVQNVIAAEEIRPSPPAKTAFRSSPLLDSLLHSLAADPEVKAVEVSDGQGRLLARSGGAAGTVLPGSGTGGGKVRTSSTFPSPSFSGRAKPAISGSSSPSRTWGGSWPSPSCGSSFSSPSRRSS